MSSVSNSTPTSDQRKPDSHSVIPKDTEENSSVLSMDLSPASPKMTGLDLWSPDQHNESLDSFPSENEDSALEEISSLPKEVTPSNAPKSSAFQLDGLLPPESLAPANIHIVETMDQAVVESKEESDRKLQEEADAELGPLLSSDPVSPLPAEVESVSNSSSRVPALGLEAVGEGASHSVSLQPTHQKYAESSDSEEALQAKPTPVNTSQPISLSPHKEKVEITSVELIERDKERAREAEASADLLIDIIKDNVELILPQKIDRTPLVQIPIQPHLRTLPEKSQRKLEAFVSTLQGAQGSNVLIVILGHPDPDSIGSAVAQQYCFRQFDIKSSILYFDEISHPENRALVKVIEMDLIPYENEFNFSEFDYLAFVDSQSSDIPVFYEGTLPPILTFVDHHKETGKVKADFIDIREGAGSTSTIYAEYLEYIPDLSLHKNLATHAHIATALMHGIRTDTDHLMLAMTCDFYAAAYLRQFIDRDLLRMVSKQSVTSRTMEIIKQGLNNKVIKGTFLLAGVGFVREEDRDGIAQTADFLLRHEGVETTVVFGIVNNNIVDGSLRTSSATVDPDRWLKELFGQDSTGRPYGGGRRNKGGFRIPLGLLAFSPDRRGLWKLGEQTIHDLIFDKIGEKEGEGKER